MRWIVEHKLMLWVELGKVMRNEKNEKWVNEVCAVAIILTWRCQWYVDNGRVASKWRVKVFLAIRGRESAREREFVDKWRGLPITCKRCVRHQSRPETQHKYLCHDWKGCLNGYVNSSTQRMVEIRIRHWSVKWRLRSFWIHMKTNSQWVTRHRITRNSNLLTDVKLCMVFHTILFSLFIKLNYRNLP